MPRRLSAIAVSDQLSTPTRAVLSSRGGAWPGEKSTPTRAVRKPTAMRLFGVFADSGRCRMASDAMAYVAKTISPTPPIVARRRDAGQKSRTKSTMGSGIT